MATSPLLTPEEAAEKLHIKPQTVRAYLRQGKIRGLQVGGKWRMTEAAFEAFVALLGVLASSVRKFGLAS